MRLSFDLLPLLPGLIQKQAVGEILRCNAVTRRFGLALTEAQAAELVETRAHALRENGRIEFGGGVIDKLAEAFCDSPYLSMRNYTQTLHALIELFYHYKNEALDRISDDDLIAFMKTAYDGACHGSLELLAGRELWRLARNARFGLPFAYSEDSSLTGEEDEDAGQH